MNKSIGKKPISTEETLINWSALSQYLAKNSDSIRQNRIPNKYKEQINQLLYYIKCWEQGKLLISPEEFKEKVRNIDLISVILEEKQIVNIEGNPNLREVPLKNPAKRMKEQIKNIENDIEIIIEAINNGDIKDAIQMLKEVKQDLKLIELIA